MDSFQVNRRELSEQTYELAQRYHMGIPLAEYRVRFSLSDKVEIVVRMFLLLFIPMMLMIIDFLIRDIINTPIMHLLLILGYIFISFGVIFYLVLWFFYQWQRYRLKSAIFLVVCKDGFLSIKSNMIEPVYWHEIQHFSLLRLYFYQQVTLYLSHGRKFYLKNIYNDFNDFLFLLKKMTNH